MNKKILANFILTALAGGMLFLFSNQFSNIKNNEKIVSTIVSNNEVLYNTVKNTILAIEMGNESSFDYLGRDIGSLKNFIEVYTKNKELFKNSNIDYITEEINSVLDDLTKIKENKNGILNIDAVIKQLNLFYKEMELIKSSIINTFNQELGNTTNAKKIKIQDGIKNLNLALKRINDIKNNLTDKTKLVNSKNDLINIINYFELQFSEISPTNVVFQKSNAELLTQIKNFREKINFFIDSKYDLDAIKQINENKDKIIKKIENLQFNLLKIIEKDKDQNNLILYLIVLLSIVSILFGYFFANRKAELSKKEIENLKKYAALNERSKLLNNSINRIVTTDSYGYHSINQDTFIEESNFKESRLGVAVSKINELLKVFFKLRNKFDLLARSSFDQMTPLIEKYKILKTQTQNGNGKYSYSLNEIEYIINNMEDMKLHLESEDKQADIISNDTSNIGIRLADYNSVLNNREEKMEELRKKMQDSSKKNKKTGEITQKLLEIHADISSMYSKIGVVSLNLGIASSNHNNIYYNYANELGSLLKEIELLNIKMKEHIVEIQQSSKETTENLDKITLNIVEDSNVLKNNKAVIDKTIEDVKNLEKTSENIFDDIDKVKSLVSNINNNINLLKNKDKIKSEVLLESEMVLNKTLETLSS